jgi:LmbE family N-acetylglucosaminyl deacetylase
MAKIHQHIYLSPHYDDAALSCGGTIHQQSQSGESVLVMTICAASPPAHELLSPFAGAHHQSWGDPDNAVAARQAEDQASMKILGADYVRLGFTDCIYRGFPEKGVWFYNNDDELFGQVHPADLAQADKIAEAIIKRVPGGRDATIYAPLTVGNHVDHQLTHVAAWQLRQLGWNVIFYEDYPYVDDSVGFGGSNLEDTLARLQQTNEHLQPRSQTFSENNLQAKINSVRAYASQLDILFGSEEEMENRVRNYALQVGKGKPAERIWIPGGNFGDD